MERLRQRLHALEGKDYAAYQSLRGEHQFADFTLFADRLQKDPYAPPGTGSYRLIVSRAATGLTVDDLATSTRRVATCDYLARRFAEVAAQVGGRRRGTGHSGLIAIARPGQAVLERTSMVLGPALDVVEVRCFLGLPAHGRTIDGPLAETMLLHELPEIVLRSLLAENLDRAALEAQLSTVEDAQALRAQLRPAGLVAFIADAAVLPRTSGADQRPLTDERAVAFRAPDGALRVTLDAPHAGPVNGLGIPHGVTLLVGGGYHGKSTLLEALAQGVYDHPPGDGREQVVTVPDAAVVRAAPGRAVTGTDISAFIGALPDGTDTRAFITGNASGSTSQAAAVAEAIEAGARLLLIDEDVSASNFLVRDARMQRLVPAEQEPITVLLDRVRQLHDGLGIGSILVMGGSGDYLDVADHVLQLADYQPQDVTARARAVASELPTDRVPTVGHLDPPADRVPLAEGIDPINEHGHRSVRAPTARRLVFGRTEIDLTDVEQLTEPAQTQAVGEALELIARALDGTATVRQAVGQVMADTARDGLDSLDPDRRGNLAGFRGLELAAALSRLRALRVAPRQS